MTTHHVEIGSMALPGRLTIPVRAKGLVIFAHGSGSSRHSPRNVQVAQALTTTGAATLLCDLLSEAEASDRNNVFDIALLGDRVGKAVDWASQHAATSDLPIGLFGASTGAAAALLAAAAKPSMIRAIVSRGGRPDLAGEALALVKAPTLLIVGAADYGVVELNERALSRLTCEKQMQLVPGATHLFEEPGALETVIKLTGQWFKQQFRE